jgi:hypothetical protein
MPLLLTMTTLFAERSLLMEGGRQALEQGQTSPLLVSMSAPRFE